MATAKLWRRSCSRGRQLAERDGRGARLFRCPYHGWSWSIDGSLKEITCEWDFPGVREKLVAPEVFGILMCSPVYMGIVSSPLKQLFERMLAFRQGGFPLKNKVGGAIAVGGGRNTGVELILQQLIMFMLSQEMILVGDGSPGDHWGGTMQSQGDELSKDEGSLNTVRGVGKRVAEIALRMAASAK